jgi:hypothetical protein
MTIASVNSHAIRAIFKNSAFSGCVYSGSFTNAQLSTTGSPVTIYTDYSSLPAPAYQSFSGGTTVLYHGYYAGTGPTGYTGYTGTAGVTGATGYTGPTGSFPVTASVIAFTGTNQVTIGAGATGFALTSTGAITEIGTTLGYTGLNQVTIGAGATGFAVTTPGSITEVGTILGLTGSQKVTIAAGPTGIQITSSGAARMAGSTVTLDSGGGAQYLYSSGTILVGSQGAAAGTVALQSRYLDLNCWQTTLVQFNSTSDSTSDIIYRANDGSTPGAVGWQPSARKYKENIVYLQTTGDPVYDKIVGLFEDIKPVTYNYITDDRKIPEAGLIADDVYDSGHPDIVNLDTNGSPRNLNERRLWMATTDMVKILWEANKELKAKVTTLESRIAALETPP